MCPKNGLPIVAPCGVSWIGKTSGEDGGEQRIRTSMSLRTLVFKTSAMTILPALQMEHPMGAEPM